MVSVFIRLINIKAFRLKFANLKLYSLEASHNLFRKYIQVAFYVWVLYKNLELLNQLGEHFMTHESHVLTVVQNSKNSFTHLINSLSF